MTFNVVICYNKSIELQFWRISIPKQDDDDYCVATEMFLFLYFKKYRD
jgi:hypothetical protein